MILQKLARNRNAFSLLNANKRPVYWYLKHFADMRNFEPRRSDEFKKSPSPGELQENIIKNFLRDKNTITSEDWENMKREVFNTGSSINPVNIDALIIGFCTADRKLDVAQTYLNHLRNNGKEPNLATLGKMLKLYSLFYEDKTVPKSVEQDIFQIYEIIKKKFKLLDHNTSDHVIHALSLTSRWKECLEIIEDMKFMSMPTKSAYCAVIQTAFSNNDLDIGWKLMTEVASRHKNLHTKVYTSWLKHCQKNSKTCIDNVEKLLKFASEQDIRLPYEIISEIGRICRITGYRTAISKIGTCRNCRQNLNPLNISKDDFQMLRNHFFKKVIIGKNVFAKSTPEEIESFDNFLKKVGRCDIVLDGLNIAYAKGSKNTTNRISADLVYYVVKHFYEKKQKVMLFGRTHMKKWPQHQMNYILSHASVFLAENISQDDPFLLYACMHSGLGTAFLSRDLMRSHAHLMGEPHMQTLFRYWQLQHQHLLIYVTDYGKVTTREPLLYLPMAQKNSNCWHLPYELETGPTMNLSLDLPKNWMCLRFKK